MTTKIDVRAAATQSELDHAAVDPAFSVWQFRDWFRCSTSTSRLFCYKLKKTRSKAWCRRAVAPLHNDDFDGASPIRAKRNGFAVRPRRKFLSLYCQDLSWIDNLGDLGVLLWLCGTVCPERFASLESRLQLDAAALKPFSRRGSKVPRWNWRGI